MIIDCHGHYTTAPDAHQKFRDLQVARLKNPQLPQPQPLPISDDQRRCKSRFSYSMMAISS